jgi:hypothetical protein
MAADLTLEEQVQLVRLVEHNDLVGIARMHEVKGSSLWTSLCSGEVEPRYPNQGTVVHWAIWSRHWDVVTLAVAASADLSVRGVGSWMNERSAAEYAALLDAKANHPYYSHAEELDKAVCAADQGCASSRIVARVWRNAQLELALFDDGARVEDRAVQVRLHDMVEHHCLGGLGRAVQHFSARAIATTLIEPDDSLYDNRGSAAHWAVWYQHWDLLRWLQANGCFDPTIKGVGRGWLRDKTVGEYADSLDAMCKHPFYGHRVEVMAALTVPVIAVSPAAAAAADVSPERRAAQCCICMDSPAIHLISPCRHLCLCGPCGEQLQAARGGGACPICRSNIASVDRVFMS